MKQELLNKVKAAVEKDPEVVCGKEDIETTLGNDANYLKDIHGLTKNDLIRLERAGLALKARYATKGKRKCFTVDKEGNKTTYDITGPHRVRWLIFKEALV